MLKNLLGRTDRSTDRAVSPVIGVILMVAITVILAAVIGTFVLDLGSSVGDTGPTTSMDVSDSSADYQLDTGTANMFLIDHNQGDSLEITDIKVQVRDSSGGVLLTFEAGSWTATSTDNYELLYNGASITGSEEVTVGDQLTITKSVENGAGGLSDDTEFTINVIHTASDSTLLDSTVELS